MQLALGILAKMAMKLLSEHMIKYVVTMGLEALVKSTATKADDKLLEEAKKQWEL